MKFLGQCLSMLITLNPSGFCSLLLTQYIEHHILDFEDLWQDTLLSGATRYARYSSHASPVETLHAKKPSLTLSGWQVNWGVWTIWNKEFEKSEIGINVFENLENFTEKSIFWNHCSKKNCVLKWPENNFPHDGSITSVLIFDFFDS